jgi:hypothetical protein
MGLKYLDLETKSRLCGCPFESGGPAEKRAQAEACATKSKSADRMPTLHVGAQKSASPGARHSIQ